MKIKSSKIMKYRYLHIYCDDFELTAKKSDIAVKIESMPEKRWLLTIYVCGNAVQEIDCNKYLGASIRADLIENARNSWFTMSVSVEI